MENLLTHTHARHQDHLISLTGGDVDLNGGLIRLRQTKNGQSRFVPLNGRAVGSLGMLRHCGLKSRPVFPVLKPRWFTKAVRKAGLKDFSWHSLRHTFARRLVMSGVDIRTVQELMGHKSIVMTMRYSHLSPAHRLVAVENLVSVVPPIVPPAKLAPRKRHHLL